MLIQLVAVISVTEHLAVQPVEYLMLRIGVERHNLLEIGWKPEGSMSRCSLWVNLIALMISSSHIYCPPYAAVQAYFSVGRSCAMAIFTGPRLDVLFDSGWPFPLDVNITDICSIISGGRILLAITFGFFSETIGTSSGQLLPWEGMDMSITLDRRQFLLGTMGVVSSVALAGCGGGSSAQDSAQREYIGEDEIDAMFTNPDNYKGKWVKLPGKTLNASSKDGDTTTIQAYYDITTYDRTYVVHSDTTTDSFASGEYILVDGMIDGTFTGKNMMGSTLTLPLISNAEISKSSYIEVVAPATSSIEPAVSVTQNDVVFSCDKVEYSDVETRVYLTINNPTPESVNFGVYNICLLVNGRQVDQDSSNMAKYEDPDDYPDLSYSLIAGASTTGVLLFPKMDASEAFQIVIPNIYCDDYTVTFEDVTLDIPAA